MVLPLPVPPMIAVVWPGSAVRLMSLQHGLLGARIPELHVAQLQPARRAARGQRAGPGAASAGSVSITSMIRSALTSARGTSMNMNVAIMTDIRICAR